MSRRAGERRNKRRAPRWPGPNSWADLRPGDEFVLALRGTRPQRFRVVAVTLIEDDGVAPSIDSSGPFVTLTAACLADPSAPFRRHRVIVTAVGAARRRR